MEYQPEHPAEARSSKAKCRLIVNADDFGLSEEINEGILQAHTKGIVTSTSLMPTGAAFCHAVNLASMTPSLDVGIHLTLVEETPLSPPQSIPSLVNDHGRFHPHAGDFLKRYLRGKISRREVRNELESQVRKVKDSGLQISHLDSHQHLHALPGIWDIVQSLAAQFDIAAVRYPRESVSSYMLSDYDRWPRLAQLCALNFFCALVNRRGPTSPDHFVGFFYGGHLSREHLENVIRHLPGGGVCEMMCHPGLAVSAEGYSHWQYRWQDELDALTDPRVKALLLENAIDLISYQDLHKPSH